MGPSIKSYLVKKLSALKPWMTNTSSVDRPSSQGHLPKLSKKTSAELSNSSMENMECVDSDASRLDGRTAPSLPLSRTQLIPNTPNRPALKSTSRQRVGPIISPAKNMEFPSNSSQHLRTVRSRRLMKEFRDISRCVNASSDRPFYVELVNDCLFEWTVYLYRVDESSDLFQDMQQLGVPHIQLSLSFPDNFPFSPPFMRVVSPSIERGFVMEGGAICMELLTPRGWTSAYTVEAIVTQFAASLVKGQGRIEHTDKKAKRFNKRLAENAFRGIVRTHEKYGWITPPLADG